MKFIILKNLFEQFKSFPKFCANVTKNFETEMDQEIALRLK